VTTRSLFATRLYEASLDDPPFVAELDAACRALARDDGAGRSWSRAHGYRGYTSYASLNDLPQRDPRFAELVARLHGHIHAFAIECAFDMKRRPTLDSLWVNLLKSEGTHSGHIHPHSIISGTVYVAAPKGSGRLKLEDPRLPMMMAAPPRKADAPEELQSFVYLDPKPGSVLLWESWLRHEVVAARSKGDRISISFNYR
jgi:uncharacterized protein (TIGR02466 family)